MLKYNLLGQTVKFEDSAERFFDLQFAAREASTEVSHQFGEWYKQCGNIQSVLDDYLTFSESMLEKYAFRPLFGQLSECEIYDVSEENYWKHCIGLGSSESALETVERQYNAILKQQNAEKEYRADRKASRSRWSGGGFGISSALKGAAEAAALNAVSGLGHSAVNAIGNAGSALSASMSKSTLYKDSATQNALRNGILADLFAAYSAHMNILNERNEDYVHSVFDGDKARALFENAKKLPEKRENLLVQAFMLCPWNEDLVDYIFVHYSGDRKTTYAAAQRFHIDLSNTVEEILSQEYTSDAQSSEQEAQAAKERILTYMREYGVDESPTLDKLETDCLHRLCKGYHVADEAGCNRMIEEVRQYAAQEQLKDPFLEQLEQRITEIWVGELEGICHGLDDADETDCERRMGEIKGHKAPEALKEPFQAGVRDRVKTIWKGELSEICRDLDLADEVSCGQRKAAIERHKAPNNMKAPFLRKVQQRVQAIWTNELDQICGGCETADESTCEGFITAIKAHKAPDTLKAPFLQKVQARIESIWSAEDGEIFDNLYMKTDITNPSAVAEAVSYVQSKGRTDSSQKYLDALAACTPKNIENARLYQNTSRYKTYMISAIICIIATPILFLPLLIAIPLFIKAWGMKKAWNLLTINGTILHPALLSTSSQDEPKN